MTKKFGADVLCGLITEFCFYGFIGWLYETILTSALWGEFAKRGFLHLPILPIYGFCGLFLVLILGKIKNIPLIFIIGTLVTTAAELAASYLLEILLNKRLWNYSGWAFNFDGRISLYSSLIFGVLCVILIKLLHPLMNRINKKLKGKPLYITASVMASALIADLIITLTS